MPKSPKATLATVRRLALALPGVVEGLSCGTPGFRVRNKVITDHYLGYPAVLVRLANVTTAELKDVLEQGWRFNAPRRLITEHDREHQ